MAQRRRAYCDAAGCDALAAPGRTQCDGHRDAAHAARVDRIAQGDAARAKTATRRLYWTQGWKRLRLAHITKNPLCVHCRAAGIITAATEVDHIKRHQGDTRRFFDASNLQSLCTSHHSVKTAAERAGRF